MTSARISILIIEDDESQRIGLGAMLNQEGYHTTLFTNGKDGLRYLQTAAPPPRVILLDMFLPEMDGWDFLEELKKLALDPKPLVIVTTGSQIIGLDWVRAHGGVGYFPKPVDMEKLLQTIKDCLSPEANPPPSP